MVYEIHSLLGDEVERDRLGRGLVFRSTCALERKVYRHAAAVIALGEPVKQVVVDEKGVPADRVSVIYPGIDLAEYDRPGPPATIPGVGPEHKVVMYVGSIVHPNQGVPILIEALPRVFDAVPEARCVLVGGPAEAGERYRARLGAHGDRLIVLTGQTPEQVVALTRRADVLVHPAAGLPRELLGAEQDRRLPRRRPADRGDRLRRLPASSSAKPARAS